MSAEERQEVQTHGHGHDCGRRIEQYCRPHCECRCHFGVDFGFGHKHCHKEERRECERRPCYGFFLNRPRGFWDCCDWWW
ncbi:MAG: hypothetical protein FWH03_01900 [Firmicutes bacterium]|nr:hypothetical protein [Bacillota bacterium]